MVDDRLAMVRRLCLALPEATERNSHGEAAFFVRDKRQFLAITDHHHGTDFFGFWCAAAPGVQEQLIAQDTERFFRPPYVGHRGWLGVRLEGEIDWDEVGEIVEDAYRQVAPAKLIAELDRPVG